MTTESANATRQIASLARRAQPLMDWYKANKPDAKVIRVTAQEWKLLQRHRPEAHDYGFITEDGRIRLGTFEIRPPRKRVIHEH